MFCPSHAWDDYHDSQELPEKCPRCGAANEDKNGEPIEPAAPGFCSLDCEADWQEQEAATTEQENHAEVYATEAAALEAADAV